MALLARAVEVTHQLRQLGDIRRNPPRFGRMYAGGAGSICT